MTSATDVPRAVSSWILQKLSRVTSSGRFVPEIDGLRFFAIAWVVLFHINGYTISKGNLGGPEAFRRDAFSFFCAQGDIGVKLFFVISGFILAVPFAEHWLMGRPRVPLKKYFLRRLTRLEPPYFSNLLLVTVLLVGVAHVMTLGTAVPHLLASLFYQHNAIYGGLSRINTVAWSLEIEVQFYTLVPLLSRCFSISRKEVRRTVLVAVIATFAVSNHFMLASEWPRLHLSLARYLHFFLTGFLLADVYLLDWKSAPVKGRLWDVVSGAAWLALTPIQAWNAAHPALPFVMFLAYVGAFRGRIVNRICRNRWLVTTGGMCYTIYLYHYQIVSALGRVTRGFITGTTIWTNVLVQLSIMVPVIFAVSALAFVALEKPFMRRDWPQQAWRLVSRAKAEGDAA